MENIEEKGKILNAQMEIISGYISKIDLNHLSITDVRDMLSADFNFLHQEFALLQAEKIIAIT